MRWVLAAALLVVSGCAEDSLAPEIARILITPMPVEGTQQRAYDGPNGEPGLNLGRIPLGGEASAVFEVENASTATLRISRAAVVSESNGTLEVVSVPEVLTATETGELVIAFAPHGHEVVGEGTVALATNAGADADEVVDVVVKGEGLFVGSPNAEIRYSGQVFPQAGDCADRGDGKNVCTLAPLDFGNVPLDSVASQVIRLLNVPASGTCVPPPGSPPCTAVCRLRIDRDPAGDDIGFGFEPANTGFGLVGNIPIPFEIDSTNEADCGFSNERRLVVELATPSQAADIDATLLVETNDPDAPYIRIPTTAAAREAPVAVAEYRACNPTQPGEPCSDPAEIRPLETVYLDGRSSYDPNGLNIVDYRWRIVDWPAGTESAGFDPACDAGTPPCFVRGSDSALFDVWLPLAGRYVARLQVTNEVGVQSGVSATSDVEIVAIPSSRVHVQLVWDNPTNDQDLHVTREEVGDLVCDTAADCHWNNCKPVCTTGGECAATPPVWDPAETVGVGPNPRLDIDDTNGLGPENVNIDAPQPGRYWVYAHYYGLLAVDAPPTTVTVRIFIDGTARAEYRRTLERNELWRVATIDWTSDDTALVEAIPSDGIGIGETTTMVGCTSPCDFEVGCY